jgi:F0F1-type ATP synthase delta subunit
MISSKTLAETVLAIAESDNDGKGVKSFMEFLGSKNLTGLLPQILHHVQRIGANSAESDTLHIYAAYKLDPTEIKKLVDIAGAKNAAILEHIDETLIGGFSATYKGYIYNGSLSHQIDRFTQTLKQS